MKLKVAKRTGHWFKIYCTENNALVMTNNKVFHHDNLTVKATDSEQKMVDKVFQKSVNRLLEVGFDTSRISLLSLVDKEANKYHLQHLHHIHITNPLKTSFIAPFDQRLKEKNVWNVLPKVFARCGQYNLQNILNLLCLYIINNNCLYNNTCTISYV